tara:strand:- start:214052 stop:215365 length:1314 start_codon:yes stop_codon:yes gene_type:complete
LDVAPLWLLFSILGGLLLLSAFFSSSETAMMSLNRYRLKHLRKKHRGARQAYKLLKRPDRLIGIILIGNNLVNILASAIATVVAIRLYGDAGIFIATLLLTLAILIFSEVTPKTVAALHPEGIAFTASYILLPLLTLFYPFVWLVNHVSNGLLRMLGINTNKGRDDGLSKDEIRTVVDVSSRKIPEHQDMLINILDLEKVSVNDIMVPRNEIIGLNLDEDIDALLNTIINCGYTRLPVYRGNINQVEGFLHMKNVARLLRSGGEGLTKEAIKRFSREPYFVPENTPLNKQLLNFRLVRRRLGLVVDEYGEVEGLVTLEDILEEIVGDFTTNKAEDEQEEIVELEHKMFEIDGSATIRDINKANDWNLPTDGPKTINGLVLEYLENIPDGNVTFTIGHYRFETLTLSGKKIARLKVKRLLIDNGSNKDEDDDEDEEEN